MTESDINFPRLNYLLSLNLSPPNVTKRLCRAKANNNKDEFICLSLVRAMVNFENTNENN